MKSDSRFFRNVNCRYFPCHATESDKDFNCLFCFCPLYFITDSGGHPVRQGKVKDCSHCDKPHRSGGYDHVIGRLTRYFDKQKKDIPLQPCTFDGECNR